MKRVIQLHTLNPTTSCTMQEHINKMQVFQLDIMEDHKDITSKDTAIVPLIQLGELNDYAAFYSSLDKWSHG